MCLCESSDSANPYISTTAIQLTPKLYYTSMGKWRCTKCSRYQLSRECNFVSERPLCSSHNIRLLYLFTILTSNRHCMTQQLTHFLHHFSVPECAKAHLQQSIISEFSAGRTAGAPAFRGTGKERGNEGRGRREGEGKRKERGRGRGEKGREGWREGGVA